MYVLKEKKDIIVLCKPCENMVMLQEHETTRPKDIANLPGLSVARARVMLPNWEILKHWE